MRVHSGHKPNRCHVSFLLSSALVISLPIATPVNNLNSCVLMHTHTLRYLEMEQRYAKAEDNREAFVQLQTVIG